MGANSNAGGFTQHEIGELGAALSSDTLFHYPGGAIADIVDVVIRLRHVFERCGLGSPDLVLASQDDVMKLRLGASEGPWTSFPAGEELERGVAMKLGGVRLYYPRPEGEQ